MPRYATPSSARRSAAAAELAAGPRGESSPFIAALRSPELMTRLQRLGEYLRYRNALGPRLTELAILITARAWSQPFEWALHVDEAEARGIARATIAAIARHRKPLRMPADEATVYDYLGELHAKQAVSDATYARAVAAFGEAGIVDLTAVAGYYTTLAMILNVARTLVRRASVAWRNCREAKASRARRKPAVGLAPLGAESGLDRSAKALCAFSVGVGPVLVHASPRIFPVVEDLAAEQVPADAPDVAVRPRRRSCPTMRSSKLCTSNDR
jgi:4-carboxymuconolactone decarboxylase